MKEKEDFSISVMEVKSTNEIYKKKKRMKGIRKRIKIMWSKGIRKRRKRYKWDHDEEKGEIMESKRKNERGKEEKKERNER